MRLPLLAALMAAPLLLCAQTVQHGVVKEYNEKAEKTPLPGVELNVSKAASTVSGIDGAFELSFLTLGPGEKVNVRRIEKLGYEIFNRDALDQWNINPAADFTIVMCRSDRFKRIRDNYERISSESYARQRKAEEAALQQRLAEGAIKEKEYQEELVRLAEEYENQLDNLQNYVDRFARIDLSEISQAEQRIVDLVQAGHLDEAIALYRDMQLDDKLETLVQQRDASQQAARELDRIARESAAGVDSIYARQRRRIDLLLLAGGPDNRAEVAAIYKRVAAADTTNVEWLLDAARYLALTQNELPEAIALANTALRNAPDEALRFRMLNAVANLYTVAGDFDSAEASVQQALEIIDADFPSDSRKRAMALNTLGVIYDSRYDFAHAEEPLRKAIELTTASGDDDIRLQSTINLGACLMALNRLDESLAYSLVADSLALAAEGEKGRSRIDILNNIGLVYHKRNAHALALDYYGRALALARDILGENNLITCNMLNNIGLVYLEHEEAARAEESFRRVLDIRGPLLGTQHIDYRITLASLGRTLGVQERYDEAIAAYTQALDGPGAPPATEYEMRVGLGNTYLNGGDPEKAVEQFNICRVALAFEGEQESARASDLAGYTGTAYMAMGDMDNAETWLLRAIELASKNGVAPGPTMATTFNNLGTVLTHRDKAADALACYETALEMQEQAYGDRHLTVASTCSNIGMMHYALGNYNDALKYLNRALAVRAPVLGNHPDVAKLILVSARSYLGAGMAFLAGMKIDEAQKMYREIYGDDHPDWAAVYAESGVFLAECGNLAEADARLSHALPILRQTFGDDDSSVVALSQTLEKVREARKE